MKINKTKIIAYLGMVSLLASMIMGLLGHSSSINSLENIKTQLLKKQVETNINLTMKYIKNSYGELTQGDETLLDKDGNSIEGRFGVVDTVLEDLGDESTVFVKVNDDFKRISTNIMSGENKRAIGTYLGSDHNAYESLINGKLYIGEASILGQSYYTAYDPIKDNNNNVIGVLFVGMSTEALDDIIEVQEEKLNKINIWIVVLRAISLGSLIVLASMSALSKRYQR